MEETAVPSGVAGNRLAADRLECWAHRLVLVGLLLIPCGYINLGDGYARYLQSEAILFHGSLAIPAERARDETGLLVFGVLEGTNGRYYSKYGLALSILWLPGIGAAWVLHALTGVNFALLTCFLISFMNVLILVVTGHSLSRICRQLSMHGLARVGTLGCYFLGITTLPLANTAFSEPLSALVILWVVAWVSIWDRPALAGLGCAIAVHIKPELLLLPLCLAPVILLRQSRWKSMIVFCTVAGLGPFSVLLLNHLQRGAWTAFSYGDESLSFGAPWQGLWGYFFSLDRNVWLFNPALVVALLGWGSVARRAPWRDVGLAVILAWLVYLPVYASWWAWGGAGCFGPRFLYILMPVTLLPAGIVVDAALRGPCTQAPLRWLYRGILGAALLVGLPIQWSGVSVMDNQAIRTAGMLGISQLHAQMRLLQLKLMRGISAPEVYRKSDFVSVNAEEEDTLLDFRKEPLSYRYLNHWWCRLLIVLGDRQPSDRS
jgi:hypothetical protein